MDTPDRTLNDESREALEQQRVGNTPGGPSWPYQAPGSAAPAAPPVGMNWTVVAERVGADQRVLQHDGIILVAGDYFPAAGYFLEPTTLRARKVDVGDIALHHGYFIGEATARQFKVPVTDAATSAAPHGRKWVIPSPGRGAVIGLFADDAQAARTGERILRASLGAGVVVESTPLGTELRVMRPQLPGRVASAIAAHGGGVIAIDGRPITSSVEVDGPMATGADAGRYPGDARRSGTGVNQDSAGPEVGSVIEAGQGQLEEFHHE